MVSSILKSIRTPFPNTKVYWKRHWLHHSIHYSIFIIQFYLFSLNRFGWGQVFRTGLSSPSTCETPKRNDPFWYRPIGLDPGDRLVSANLSCCLAFRWWRPTGTVPAYPNRRIRRWFSPIHRNRHRAINSRSSRSKRPLRDAVPPPNSINFISVQEILEE